MEAERPQKQGVRNEKVYFILAFNDRSKRIDSITKIGIAAYDIDSGEVIRISIFKHGESRDSRHTIRVIRYKRYFLKDMVS